MRAVKAKLDEIKGYAPAPGVPAGKTRADGQIGRRAVATWLRCTMPRCHGHPMLDLGATELWLQRLHADEHDERELHAQRVRGGRHRRAYDVRHAIRRRLARRTRRLEQQLRRRRQQVRRCSTAATGPKAFLPDIKIANAPILGTTLGVENTYGASGRPHAGGPADLRPHHHGDADGCIRAYVGEGELTNDELKTFGTRAVAHVPQLQKLLQYVCAKGFEHHVVMTQSQSASILAEAFENYFGWETYVHKASRRTECTDHATSRCKSIHILAVSCSRPFITPGQDTRVAVYRASIFSTCFTIGCCGYRQKHSPIRTRDRYIQSKGHSVEALYVVLADRGFFPKSELETLCSYQSPWVGHPTRKVPGIEMNTGALGHGLPICVGLALAGKMDDAGYRVFTLLGDGELAEGSNWEAAMAAAHYQLDNLTAILDHNTLQITGRTRDVCTNEPIDEKFRAFGWNVAYD